jgi:hypothetical protein
MRLQPLIMVRGCVFMPMCLSFGSGFQFWFKSNRLWTIRAFLISLKLLWLPWWNMGAYQRWMWQKNCYSLMHMGLLFWGGETRVIRQIKDVCVWVPFSMGVHCVVHRINLGIQSLSNWTLFVWLVLAFIIATLTLGLRPRQGLAKLANQEWSLGVTFHTLGSVGKCEGINPHTPKWVPILRVGIPMDPQTFKEQFQGTKLIGLKISLYPWKALGT